MTTIRIPPAGLNPPSHFFREKNDGGSVDVPEIESRDSAESDKEKALVCSRCRTVITSSRHLTEVNGGHLHTFFNPAGVIYEIGCYKQARGCVVHGLPTEEFSWFKGYVWQYAACITCQDHLGWFFSSDETVFFGLISSKLLEE